MIIKNIYYKAYGKFVEKSLNFHEGINLIYGKNEAGKSTVFSSLLTLIYGFSPANKSQHPYTHWEKQTIDFSSEIGVGQELFSVERRLMSAPQLNIINGDTQQVDKKRNDVLPWTNNVSERLFASVFHLTSEDLLGFESASWDQLKERLIHNYGTRHVLNPSHVLPQMTQDIHNLWRNDRRGNPKIAQLNASIRQLATEKNDLERAYRLIKEKEEEFKKLEASEKHCVEQIYELKTLKNQMRELIPIKKVQKRVSILKKTLKNAALDFDLIGDLNRLNTLIDDAEHEKEVINQKKEHWKEKKKSFTDEMKALVQHQDMIKTIKSQTIDYQYVLKKIEGLEVQFKQKENEFVGKLKAIFSELPSREWMYRLNLVALKSDVQEYMTYNGPKKMGLLEGAIGLVFLVLSFSIWLENGWLIALNGLTLLVISTAKIIKISRCNKLKKELLMRIYSYFEKGVFPKYMLSDLSLDFFNKMESVFIEIEHLDALSKSLENEKKRASMCEEDIKKGLMHMNLPLKRDLISWVGHIEFLLEEAMKENAVQNEVEFECKQLNQQQLKLNEALQGYQVIKKDYESQILSLGDGTFDLGIAKIKESQNSALELNSLIIQLDRYKKEETHIETWNQGYPLSEEGYEALENDLNELIEMKETMAISKSSLQKDIQMFMKNQRYEQVENDLFQAEKALEKCQEQKDVWLVVRELISYADENFRIKHQPNMMHSVSQLMSQITDGKYKEVLLEENSNALEMYFRTDEGLLPLSLAFSKGTLHQLFFAFRIALIMEIDPEGHLPIVLDEAFVSWDRNRLKSTVQIIKDISLKRQVFVLTCHDALKEVFPESTHIKL